MRDKDLPSWANHMIDQRLARIAENLPPASLVRVVPIIVTPLSELREEATKEEYERWDRACDNCGAYCPEPIPFYALVATRQTKGYTVQIHGGSCQKCKELP